MTENNDPWANLADSLGAAPGGEPVQKTQQRAVKPSKPVETKKTGNETPAAKKSETDWGGLANQLGLESSAPVLPKPEKRVEQKDGRRAAPPPQADMPAVHDGFGAGLLDDGDSMPQPSSRPPRRSNDKPRQSSRPPRSNNDVEQETPAQADGRPESGDQTTDESGEPRRRRRGRRGGRGRGRRNDRSGQNATRPQGEGHTDDNEELPGYGRNLGGERNERHDSASETPQAHRSQASEQEDVFGHGLDVSAEQRNSENGTGPRSDSSQDDDQEQSRAGDRPPRRRRRRRRGRRTRDGEVVGNDGQRSGEEESEESDAVKVNHQAAEKPFTEQDSGENENSDGEPRRRRRRRRRRRTADEQSQETIGEDRLDQRSGAGDAGGQRRPDRSGGRGREARRGGDGEGRRRGTFSRVGSRREDDEEGLEFLGTEGELAPSDQRDNGDEDLLSDSGLDGVRDVPSWVEAIGIVIASNMDSRKQPPQT